MPLKNRKVFLDTSVVFAAVLSDQGGARVLFRLAEIGAIRLMIGPSVLKEADEVVRRKAPKSMPLLAQLLDAAHVEIGQPALAHQQEQALAIIKYPPDAAVLAEALRAEPDWVITHDQEHFLSEPGLQDLPFKVGTPGDLLAEIKRTI
jgi:predicted nucleic acid-binding protein